MASKNLTRKQRLFCEKLVEYGMNGTKAALEAGYGNGNAASASVQASRLLKNDMVQKYINILLEELKETAQINSASVLMGIKNIAFNPATPSGTQLQALKLLGEYLQIFKQEPQVVVNNNVSNVEEMTDEEIQEELAKLEEVDVDESEA